MGGQRDVDNAPEITEYGFDASLTNFEGMGPKLLPLTLKPGQDPAEPGRIWANAERLGQGVRWMQRSEITRGFVDEAIPFIDKAAKDGKPFYINLWPDDVHSPFWPPVAKWGNNKRELYLAVLEAMDEQLGKLFNHIRSNESLRDNTLVLVCSDNGPELGAGVAGPFRGYKTHLYEGGVRSSLVAWGPGLVKAKNRVNRKSVFSAIDLVPTLLDITGTLHVKGTKYDGESLQNVLLGRVNASRNAPSSSVALPIVIRITVTKIFPISLCVMANGNSSANTTAPSLSYTTWQVMLVKRTMLQRTTPSSWFG